MSEPGSAALSAPPQWREWLATLTWTPVSVEEFKQLSKEEQLTRIRHSAAHVLASALAQVRSDISFAVGPATPQGYFYDVVTETPLREEDLEDIQKRMDEISEKSHPFEVAEAPKPKAVEYFRAMGQKHKLDILERIASDTVTLYRHGEFIDLCAGPHVPHTGVCRNNKVVGLSGAHWRGEDVPSLTRVTGTAWSKPKDLERYLEFLEESKARDHRTLGPQLDLFTFHPWASAAMWHPHGMTLRNTLMAYWRETIQERENGEGGYVEIHNPLLYRKELFETSGHWDHFQENMFIFNNKETGEAEFALKPMNCPDTMLYFRSQLRSYRDLPLRIAEGQILHRNEASGALHGLMRTRSFVQDDAHLFVAPEHVEGEIQALLAMLDEVYNRFGLTYEVHFSTRPENFMGEISVWDQAEAGLKAALESTGKPYILDPGEGAFYGPKVDIYVLDSLGRQWQCGTVQLDFQLPERFELKYIDAEGHAQRPIVIHRAIFGSFERFIGILIEHLGGAFPTWLAPVQTVVLPVAERHVDYASQVRAALRQAGLRAEVWQEESINYRIRQAETGKIPYMLVVGDREAEANSVSVRRYFGGQQGVKSLEEIKAELLEKTRRREFDVEVKEFGDLFRKPSREISTEDADY